MLFKRRLIKKIGNQVFYIKTRICNWLKAQRDSAKSEIQTVNSSSIQLRLKNTEEHVPGNSILNQHIVDMLNSLINIQAAQNIGICIFSGNPLD